VNAWGDSGIFFRARYEIQPTVKHPLGYEAQIAARTGTVLVAQDVFGDPAGIPADTWFTGELIVTGKRVVLRIDGKVTANFEDAEGRFTKGHFALQVFTPETVVHFRKIELKELPPEEPAWVQLFNGKDLDGWTPHGKQLNKWKVEGSLLIGQGPDSSLYTKDQGSRPFHLRAVARINEGGSGHIAIHTAEGSAEGAIASIRSTADDTQRRTGHLYGSFLNFMTDNGPPTKPSPKAGEWFTLEVLSNKGLITARVNGEQTSQINIGGRFGGTNQIGLHAATPETVLEFKTIEIKELPPNEPAWVQLFNGADLRHWKKHPDFPADWKLEGGVLIGRGAATTLLTQRDDYENFHYRIEAKINKGGRAGQMFRCAFAPLVKGASPPFPPQGYVANIGAVGRIGTGTLARYTENSPGSYFGVQEQVLVPPDTWFTQELIADGSFLVLKVNDKIVATVDEDKLASKDPGTRRKGCLGLHIFDLGNNSELHVRKVEFKELPATPPHPGN
jgi:hypothetical protein